MPTGPFGGPRFLVSDDKTVTVVCGTATGEPQNQNIRNSISDSLEYALSEYGEVSVLIRGHTKEDREYLRSDVLGVIETSVATEKAELSSEQIEMIENAVVRKLEEMAFDITGTKTVVQ